MSAAAATNRVTAPVHSHSNQYSGITANSSIPVGAMEQWRLEAIHEVIAFGKLPQDWDSHGSEAPAQGVRQTAIDLLLKVPGELFSAPRIVPVSGGGYHLEWTVGQRELEISVEPDCRIETLRVDDGMPIEDGQDLDFSALFNWLASR